MPIAIFEPVSRRFWSRCAPISGDEVAGAVDATCKSVKKRVTAANDMMVLLSEIRDQGKSAEGQRSDGILRAGRIRPAQSAASLYFRNHVVTRSPVLDITFPVQLAIEASLGLYSVSADNARGRVA